MNKYKICMILPAPYPANRGTPARVYEMSELLVENGHDVHVVCYNQGVGRQSRATIHRIPKTPFYRKGIGPSWDRLFLDFLLFLKVFWVCSTRKIDKLHCHLHEGCILSVLVGKLLKIPVVFDIHSSLAQELVEQKFINTDSALYKFAKLLDRNLPKYVEYNVVLNKNLCEIYENMGIKNIVIIPNCTDIMIFKPFQTDLRSVLGIDNEVVIVGYQGNLSGMQNVELLVKMADKILKKRADVKFLIGHTSDPTDIKNMVEEKGFSKNFILINTKFNQAPQIINACDIMVIPRRESFGAPLKLLNFMACGKPVILFKSVSEGVIKNNSKVVYQVESEQEFLTALEELINDRELRREIGKNARNYAVSEFSKEKLYKNLMFVYKQLNKGVKNV